VRSFEGGGYESPEDAVTAYVAAFARGDLPGMVRAFSVENYVTHFDAVALLEHTRAFLPISDLAYWPMYPQGNLNAALNESVRYSTVVREISNQYRILFGPDLEWDTTTSVPEEGDAQVIVEELRVLNDARLGALRTASFVPLELAMGDQWENHSRLDRGQKAIADRMSINGAAEIVTSVVGVEEGAASWLMFVQVAKYGDHWYIDTLNGVAAELLGIGQTESGTTAGSRVTSEMR
jgi:hypothetical protein